MGFVVLFICFVLPLIFAGYFYLKKKYSYFDAKGIPYVKPNSWILGSFGEIRSKIHLADFYMKSYEENKEKSAVAGFFSMFTPAYIIMDLETVRNITVKDFNYFSHRGIYVNEDADKISGHLFSLDGEKWRFLRNKLSPAFSSGKIKMMFETVSGKGVNLVQAIEKAAKCGSVDMKEMAIRFTVDSISSCAFGMESNTLKNEHPEFLEFFKDINNPDGSTMVKSLLVSVFPKLSKFLNLRLFLKKTEEFICENVGGTINFREKNKIVMNDFLNMLIQLKNKGSIDGGFLGDSRKLTFDECLAQA